MASVFKNPQTLHGKKVVLTRDGKEVNGVLSAKNLKNDEAGFSFKWITAKGATCISDVTEDELLKIKSPQKQEEQDD